MDDALIDEADWERRLALLWASIDDLRENDFLAAMEKLVAERPGDDPVGLFEHASAEESVALLTAELDRELA